MGLTIALSLAAGLLATVFSQHLRLPSIVVLLAAGALLGPDGLNVIQPQELGDIMPAIVGFAVAIILFEGGMNLNLKRLRQESASIQRLITFGAVITAAGGALSVRLLMNWSWELSLLFGALVIVTGPTVISPLLRRIKVNHNLHTILEAEGVLIDPIGAIIAIVTLEVILHPGTGAFASGVVDALLMLGLGALLGLTGGFLIALLLRPKRLIPEGLENIFVLAFVLALYHLSNEFQNESGIAAVAVAGLVVGNIKTRALRDLMEFKEQLTVLLIALLFVLLAADVRFADITNLGWPGVFTVLALILIVRPLNVGLCTIHSQLTTAERAFLGWLAPRGIVAAAVASFIAITLNEAGIPGGDKLRALVFLVIAITVLLQGLTGNIVAHVLGVKKPASKGYAILGANEVAREMAAILRKGGEDILFMDSNPDGIQTAQDKGFRAVFGNALEERTMQRAGLGDYAACIGLTTNEEVNLLFVSRAKSEFRTLRLYVALHVRDSGVTPEMIEQAGATILFGTQLDLDQWSVRLRRGMAKTEMWTFGKSGNEGKEHSSLDIPEQMIVALAVHRNDKVCPADSTFEPKENDVVSFLIFEEKKAEAELWLNENGWSIAQHGQADGGKGTA